MIKERAVCVCVCFFFLLQFINRLWEMWTLPRWDPCSLLHSRRNILVVVNRKVERVFRRSLLRSRSKRGSYLHLRERLSKIRSLNLSLSKKKMEESGLRRCMSILRMYVPFLALVVVVVVVVVFRVDIFLCYAYRIQEIWTWWKVSMLGSLSVRLMIGGEGKWMESKGFSRLRMFRCSKSSFFFAFKFCAW